MLILAIDPGDTHSAWVMYDTLHGGRVHRFGKDPNSTLRAFLTPAARENAVLVLEMIASYGMPVGREVFETCVWIGRFEEAWLAAAGIEAHRLFRREVKLHLCGQARAKDPNVRQCLVDRFGGARCKGTKKSPGPLHGVTGDVWAALAVAVTFADTKGELA